MADISSIKLNDITYNIKDETARNNINSITNNYLPLTGGTLAGRLNINLNDTFINLIANNVDSTTTPNSNKYENIIFSDKNNLRLSAIETTQRKDKSVDIKFIAYNQNQTNTGTNYFGIGRTAEGENTYSVASPAIFCNTINAVNKSGDTMTGKLTVSNGDIEISNGSINVNTSGTYNWRGFRVSGSDGWQGILTAGNRFTFDQYLNGSTGGERYLLPVPEARSTDAWYPILTGKTPVTVEQGGTGGKDSGIVNCTLGSGVTGTVTVRKIGVFVELYCEAHITNGLAADGNIKIGIVPSGYRPPTDRRLPCGDGGRFGCLYVTPAGNMIFYNDQVHTLTNSHYVACHTFYFV